jgi:hypothetical protein
MIMPLDDHDTDFDSDLDTEDEEELYLQMRMRTKMRWMKMGILKTSSWMMKVSQKTLKKNGGKIRNGN